MGNVPGEWECRSHLGTGGFGVVELWRNNATMETIAIKRCKGKLTERETQRWMNEVEIMNSLRHRNIVGTRTVPEQLRELQNPLPVLCMEYCSLGDLRKVLNESSNCCGVEENKAFRIMRHVAAAVEYLHSQKLTHRDLKPENIVIQDSRQGAIYKLTDFGYICELGEDTIDRSVVGTLNYLAPELLREPGYTCSVDYWSLGVLFYEIITGNRPFFPEINVTPKWMDYMQKKGEKHICAHEEDGRVVFSEEIETPTTLSDCMRDELRVWFRLALQWDPKSRGRVKDEGGDENLVVFSLLKNLLSFKILYVFVVHLYRLDSYVVGPTINVRELQILLRDKTGIEVTDQIVSNSECDVLREPDSMVFDNTKVDSYLYVFNSGGPRVSKIPPPIESRLIQRILRDPKKLLNHESIKRHYRAVVFFVNQQRQLFSTYVFALSVNIDLSNKALENLDETVKNLRTRADSLMRELTILKQPSEYDRMSHGLRGFLDTTMSKTQNLFENTKAVTANIDELTKEFENLGEISENTWLEQWTIEYKKATTELETIMGLKCMPDSSPLKMAKLIYRVLKMQNKQLRYPEIDKTVRRITEFQRNVLKLQDALDSFHGLIDLYRKNYEEISIAHGLEDKNWCSSFIDSTPRCDTLIYDNRVLHNLIESLDGFRHPSIEDIESMDL